MTARGGAGLRAPFVRSPRLPQAAFPRLDEPDSSAALLREGYQFGGRRFQRSGSDAFQTRLLLRRAVFAYGVDAARELYQPDLLTRRRAMPLPSLALLLDLGSVAMLEGRRHRVRKQMFLSLMTPAALDDIADRFERAWRRRVAETPVGRPVVLLDQLHSALCEAVCGWSGLELTGPELDDRTAELVAMFEGAGTVGPRNWRGHVLRSRCEQWARNTIDLTRTGSLQPPDGSPLRTIAEHREADGQLLSRHDAAVELINVLRPTVAVARFAVFAALALHEHPEQRQLVASDEHLGWFVQEVRRYYPFFPLVGARVLQEHEWRGVRLRRGTWLLLDLYATNHDERVWQDPHVFRPERFRDGPGDVEAFALVPQGGGDPTVTHRCAGEALTVALVSRAVRMLTSAITYEVPPQDLSVTLNRMPAAPRSGFVMSGVRLR